MAVRLLVTMAALLAVQPADSVKRWRDDIAVARSQFFAKDLSFTPERRALAERRLDRLAEQVPALTDQQIVAELARVAALADNGHTRAYLLRNRGWWRRYPVRIWKFSDGWRIVAVRPGHEALLGARITAIGRKPIAKAEAAMRSLYAGPRGWARYMASYTLTSPDALLGTGVIEGDGTTTLSLEKAGRRFSATVAPVAEPKRSVPEESWWFLSPAHPATQGWVQLLAGKPLPASLDHPQRWYELRRCENKLLYLAFSRAEDQPGQPSLAEFGKQALETIAQDAEARLMIDLRFNTGGNLQKTRGLFESIARTAQGHTRGRLFVILGPSTFSAGITPAAILRQDGEPILVGSEPGDRTTFWAEGGNVLLPNSGINLHYADRAHVYAPGKHEVPANLLYLQLNGGALKPDLPVDPSFADYAGGRDPVTERIEPKGLRCT